MPCCAVRLFGGAAACGGAPLLGGGSGSSWHASRASCTDSTKAATSGARWLGGTASARARRRSRNSLPGDSCCAIGKGSKQWPAMQMHATVLQNALFLSQ